jgi:hypothetical protein
MKIIQTQKSCMITFFISIGTLLIGALIGAWINNITTWKIKNKVDALDEAYKAILDLNSKFLIWTTQPLETDPQGWLNKKEINVINTSVYPNINNLRLWCFIIDGKRGGEFYTKTASPFVNFIVNSINGSSEANCSIFSLNNSIFEKAFFYRAHRGCKQHDELENEHEALVVKAQDVILSQRAELISFRYILTECCASLTAIFYEAINCLKKSK